ncbi:hypothetical protein S83_038390, partial [Arachis hypogaea]
SLISFFYIAGAAKRVARVSCHSHFRSPLPPPPSQLYLDEKRVVLLLSVMAHCFRIAAAPALYKLISASLKQQKKLQNMSLHAPSQLPDRVTISYSNTNLGLEALNLKVNEEPAPLPKDVGKICGQLPALQALNLSNNLMSPHKPKLSPLESIRILVELLRQSLIAIEELHLIENNIGRVLVHFVFGLLFLFLVHFFQPLLLISLKYRASHKLLTVLYVTE